MKNKLILFDIDGILIKAKAIGVTTHLLKKYFNLDPFQSKVYVEGKTFRQIYVEKLQEAGIKDPEKDSRFEKMLYDTSVIKEKLSQGATIEKIPGVENLIIALKDKGYFLGLLTGNSREVSKIKLGEVGLWKYFEIGAYGSETKVRSELVEIAKLDAYDKLGIEFVNKDIISIGDTLGDIKCAKDANIKIIAVATGKEDVEILKKGNPDFLYPDFSDIESIIKIIEK
jgi:phosphoglycolate phosphatase-like HAD superfamily hydrolase